MNRCRRILEIGTLGGYSAIWLARALPPSPSSKVITLEINENCANIARQNIANAGLENVVEVKLGPALQTLEKMASSSTLEKFDLVFIDADKKNNPDYVRWALELSNVGTVIVIDNVVRKGVPVELEGSAEEDEALVEMRELFEMMKGERRLDCTAVQTVGSKGWDGFALALVVD